MSKSQAIEEHLRSGRTITPIEALNLYHSFRLADVVFRLKKKGMRIRTDLINNGETTFASYRMEL